ncbi:hypothetical protein [Neorhizobium galegae]|nr:hypothetical protein [Neorhizobium galegae]
MGLALVASPARADFLSWGVETVNDPFSGGQKVQASYSSSMRSGVFIICDTSASGMEVRVLAGWEYTADIEGMEPKGRFAVDGKIVGEAEGRTGAFGQNIAGASFTLDQPTARLLAAAMAKATSQIAVQDGISDRPQLLKPRGSTKAGQALSACLGKQGAAHEDAQEAGQVVTPPTVGDASENAKRYARFMALASAVEEKCKDYRMIPDAKRDNHLAPTEAQAAAALLGGEKTSAKAEVNGVSCAAGAALTARFTNLPYDAVWKAR